MDAAGSRKEGTRCTTRPAGDIITRLWIQFCNSCVLPFQSYSIAASKISAGIAGISRLRSTQYLFKKSSNNSGMSCFRSVSRGKGIRNSQRRYYRYFRNLPSRIFASISGLQEDMKRTLRPRIRDRNDLKTVAYGIRRPYSCSELMRLLCGAFIISQYCHLMESKKSNHTL